MGLEKTGAGTGGWVRKREWCVVKRCSEGEEGQASAPRQDHSPQTLWDVSIAKVRTQCEGCKEQQQEPKLISRVGKGSSPAVRGKGGKEDLRQLYPNKKETIPAFLWSGNY